MNFSSLFNFHWKERFSNTDTFLPSDKAESKNWGKLVSANLAPVVVAFNSDMSTLADLNKFEAKTRGEFGIGSAAQCGSADLRLIR